MSAPNAEVWAKSGGGMVGPAGLKLVVLEKLLIKAPSEPQVGTVS